MVGSLLTAALFVLQNSAAAPPPTLNARVTVATPVYQPNGTVSAVGMGLEIRLGHVAPAAPPAGVIMPLGVEEGGVTGALDGEVWLLHTLPSGVEHVQHQTIRLSAGGAAFTFTPEKFTTGQGDVTVELTGSFRRYRAPAGGEFLLVALSRMVNSAAAPPAGITGTTSSLVALPGPTEVLSFEMPNGGMRGGTARAGGGGGGGRPTRGFGGGGGAVMRGGGGTGGGGARSGASGAGGFASGSGGGGLPAAAAQALQATALLDGHVFSIRLRVTPAPGS